MDSTRFFEFFQLPPPDLGVVDVRGGLEIEVRVEANPTASEKALSAAEATAKALWRALDGIEASRLVSAA
ncbi:MAG TPA: hypothetical protein VGV15_07990 [Terriglobales bacterium]|nr:hypothetical protein [Terriglobales bacterium]